MKKQIILYITILLLTSTLSGCAKTSDKNPTSTTNEATTEGIKETISEVIKETTSDNLTVQIPATLDVQTISHLNSDYVKVIDFIPNAIIDLKYATADNFTKIILYNFRDAYLRYGTTLKLLDAAQQLEKLGYKIKIWDAFRPFEVQIALWNVYPDGNYVANPKKGYTGHNIGNTIDLTIVALNGDEINMPTEFDDFTKKADRNYSELTLEQSQNAILLETIMTNCGFKGYSNEWWHYEDLELYPADETFLPPSN